MLRSKILAAQHRALVRRQRTALALCADDDERQAVLSVCGPLISRANSAVEYARACETRETHPWHTAPDGTPCRCTAEDRRYGCGCR
ncbi:hypothetical protein M0R72_06380 [Candidatus Pacearchaeota archaeon]|nr:hypothetical protein [Candidatus Pacearchaeota archaeon]